MKAILIIITLAITATLFATGKQINHQSISNDTDTVVVVKVDTTVTGEWGK